MSDHFTAVFRVTDKAKFAAFVKQITSAFAGETQIEGAEVTGVGWCDAMTESDLLRDWVDNNGGDSEAVMRGES